MSKLHCNHCGRKLTAGELLYMQQRKHVPLWLCDVCFEKDLASGVKGE